MIKLFGRKKKEEKKGIQVGDRFAIKYSSIATPLYYKDEHPYSCAMIKYNSHDLDCGEIGELWTVIEYIGDGQFLDLISGEVFRKQIFEEYVHDTVTQSYEEVALKEQQELLDSPLAIGVHGYSELTTEIKQSILQKTMPKSKEIISTLGEMKEEAVKLISFTYERINKAAMAKQHEEALAEDRRRAEEARRQRLEAERLQKEEERRLAAERLQAEIDPKFDAVFPKRLIK